MAIAAHLWYFLTSVGASMVFSVMQKWCVAREIKKLDSRAELWAASSKCLHVHANLSTS